MIRKVTVQYNGIELQCKGYYLPYKNFGRDNPPQEECFEIESIYFKDKDVTDLIDAFNFDCSELECLCIEHLKD